jgi:hypothetical protein
MQLRRFYEDPIEHRRIELAEIALWLSAHPVTRGRTVCIGPTALFLPKATVDAGLSAAVQRYWEREAAWIERHERKYPHRTWWRAQPAPAA